MTAPAAPVGAPTYTPGVHVPVLDGLRGLAILMVLFQHTAWMMDPGIPVTEVVYRLMRTGWIGVDLFFVLSGFLITGILVDTKGRPYYLRNFYVRRMLRIFPLYYGFLAFIFFVLPMLAGDRLAGMDTLLENQHWYWTYLVNFLVPLEGGDATPLNTTHLWSLAVEEQFYLVWPFVVLWLGRRRLVQTCAGMVAGALLVRIVLVVLGGGGTDAGYMLMPARMDTFALGGLAALAMRDDVLRARLARWWPRALPGLLGALVVLGLHFRGLPKYELGMQTVGYTVLAALATTVLVALLLSPSGSAAHRVFTWGWLRTFGKYSYAIYVFHFPLQAAVESVLGLRAVPLVLGYETAGQVLYTAGISLVSLLLAWLSWHLYEKHFLALKRFFPNGGGGGGMAAAPTPGRAEYITRSLPGTSTT